jgi:hypothetical protein
MSTQNLISAVISPELGESIMNKLNALKTDLDFVIALLPEEKNEYLKVKNVMVPFLDRAYNAAVAHPEILPGIFNIAEFKKDYELTKALIPIAEKLNEITAAVNTTLYAANSDTMGESLEVYACVKQYQNSVPGLDVEAGEMGPFFRRPHRSKPESDTPTA